MDAYNNAGRTFKYCNTHRTQRSAFVETHNGICIPLHSSEALPKVEYRWLPKWIMAPLDTLNISEQISASNCIGVAENGRGDGMSGRCFDGT
jgi:hypothetical protein